MDLTPALAPLIERVRTDVTATRSAAGNMIWTREELTPLRIQRHLAGDRPRGVCPIKAGESTTRVALFDLDSHKGETPFDEMIRVSDQLFALLEMDGCYPERCTSSGGRGIHIYVVWDEPQDAYSVRMAMADVLAAMGYKNGARGVAAGEIEIFPKQDAVPAEGFGNQFILPLYGKSQPIDHPLLGSELLPREAALEWRWRGSEPVVVRERPVVLAERREIAAEGMNAELKRVRAALAAIDNDGEGLGYDEWRDIIVAVSDATGGSDEGYELAYEFSARSSKFEEAELRDKVWGWAKPGKEGGITAATLWAKARDAGWNDVSAEDFPILLPAVREPREDAVPEGHDLGADLPWPAFRRDNAGRIEATIGNVKAALTRIDVCGMELRYDEFRDEIVFCERGAPGQWQRFFDRHYVELRLELERIGFKPIGREMIRDAVDYVATEAPIDTAMAWLDGLRWDGVSRVDGFLARYFGVEAGAYAAAVSRYWWTALAGRVLSPGCQADMAPVLVSPEQGLRKSSAIAAMVPDDTHRVLNFQQAETERSRLMRGCLSAELAELHGLKTRAREEIRAWMTKRHEEWTPKFKEMSVRRPRRCVFAGTSNSEELFEEFERRWLPVRIGQHIDVEGIKRDRDQLWAEAAALWAADGVAWAEAERLVKEEQGAFRTRDMTWEEALERWVFEGEQGCRPADTGFSLREALVEGLGFVDKNVDVRAERRAASALKAIGFESKHVWADGKTAKRWVKRV